MASVQVALRVRPFSQKEKELSTLSVVEVVGNITKIRKSIKDRTENEKEFVFDHSYWSVSPNDPHFATQEKIFQDLGIAVVNNALEGYNACLFAYGQTGSGKTHTMMGTETAPGLIPRICQMMFDRMEVGESQNVRYKAQVSYFEIYNEKVKDLLRKDSGNQSKTLRVREHPKLGPYVEGLSLHPVNSFEDVSDLLNRGMNKRATASTLMNDSSSRSHAILSLSLVQASLTSEGGPRETSAKVHLVDLAGSERADQTGATGQRLKEGSHINKSLVALGLVITALTENCHATHTSLESVRSSSSAYIPYRDSALTWLLKDSLGGNSKTVMIATISPSEYHYAESLSTLRYASRAAKIINSPHVNEDPNTKLIRELRAEIERLRSCLGNEQNSPLAPPLLARLQKTEAKEKELRDEWEGKWGALRALLNHHSTLGLRQAKGRGVVLESSGPHLVALEDDLCNTGITLYPLKEGENYIGSVDMGDPDKLDIMLEGEDIQAHHCTIMLEKGTATLCPIGEAVVLVNHQYTTTPSLLSQGCVIVLGECLMLRYNDPIEAAKLKQQGHSRLSNSRLSLISRSINDLSNRSDYEQLENAKKELEAQRQQLEEERRLWLEEKENLARKCKEQQGILDESQKQREMLANEIQLWETSRGDQVANISRQMSELKDQEELVKMKEQQLLWETEERKAKMAKEKLDAKLALQQKKEELQNRFMQKFQMLQYCLQSSQNVRELLNGAWDTLDKHFADQRLKLDEKKTDAISNLENTILTERREQEISRIEHDYTNSLAAWENRMEHAKELHTQLLKQKIELWQTDQQLSALSSSDDVPSVSSKMAFTQISENGRMSSPSDYSRSGSEGKKSSISSYVPRNTRRLVSPEESSIESDIESDERGETWQRNEERRRFLLMRKELRRQEKERLKQMKTGRCVKPWETQYRPAWHSSFSNLSSTCDERSEIISGSVTPVRGSTMFRSNSLEPNLFTAYMNNDVLSPIPVLDIFGSFSSAAQPLRVAVPSYMLKEVGKDSHYEYEITIHVEGESWSIYRRYRRFRELHLYMCAKYGKEVAGLDFPPRKLLNSLSEKTAKERRPLLEAYLRRLIEVSSDLRDSPLAICRPYPTKQALFAFSAFFRKALSEPWQVTG